jgi:hypothetical protein
VLGAKSSAAGFHRASVGVSLQRYRRPEDRMGGLATQGLSALPPHTRHHKRHHPLPPSAPQRLLAPVVCAASLVVPSPPPGRASRPPRARGGTIDRVRTIRYAGRSAGAYRTCIFLGENARSVHFSRGPDIGAVPPSPS